MEKSKSLVIIDEGHFYQDLCEGTLKILENFDVIVAGLYADFLATPFENMTKLIVHADNVHFIKALCLLCKDGTHATYTKRLSDEKDRILLGGKEKYISVCRKHFQS